MTLSIGIATLVPDEDTRSDWLLGQADQALYAAKYSGRNQVVSADKVLAAFAGARDLRDEKAEFQRDHDSGAQARREKVSLAHFQHSGFILRDAARWPLLTMRSWTSW